jgi:UDP-glucose 4-epimerase
MSSNNAPGRRFAVLGAGFIGLNLVRRLASSGSPVAVLDHNPAPSDLDARVRWIQGEFADPAAVRETLDGAGTAIHLLSSTVPGDEHIDVSRELSENVFSTLGFLDLCESLEVPRVVFASSSSVYGVQDRIPTPESAVTDPISSHGIQKLAIEKYLHLRRFQVGLDVRIARLSNPYGPGQKLYGRQGFVAMMIGHLLKNEPVLLRDAGRPVRDFIYIDDVTEALERLATLADAPSLVNLGSGAGHSLQQLMQLVEEVLGYAVPTVAGEARRADIPVSVLDVSLAARGLGFRPSVSLREGLARTFRHYAIELRPAAPRQPG